jgi:metallo-beta-lactamase family protein
MVTPGGADSSHHWGHPMHISFLGADREVTGSRHMVEVNGQRILLDCGLYQGHRADTYQRNLTFPFDPTSIDVVVLSHAHIDHSGNLPNLVKQGYTGNIWSTAATRDLSAYMLLDSGHIQEQDVYYLNKKRRRKGEPEVDPIYTRMDAERCLPQFISMGFHRTVTIADGVDLTFFNAGHILGAAFVQLDIREHASGKKWRLVFSGDIGRKEVAILNPPEAMHDADIVIMESTYGDRLHGKYAEARHKLRKVVNKTANRGGKVIIPSFAVGRTQEIVYALNQLDAAGEIPPLPVFVDSPLAVNATDVFRMHPEAWNTEVHDFMIKGRRHSPFDYSRIEYVRDVQRSKELNSLSEPAIIISASGMAENGRILHHLKNNIGNPRNTILLVSFMAENTLGRHLKDGDKRVRIFGEEYDVQAQVTSIDGYSAHADQRGLLSFARGFDRHRLQKLFLVHGEPKAIDTLAGKLQNSHYDQIEVPVRSQKFEF